ncbi:MAG TPA: tetratricopeptide repeat protein, partial [Ramlibacter sp.]|nr:tetratricopeptide repeat protein [Ramlibacter sp.]
METWAAAEGQVDEAWRRFAGGDLAGAIAAAAAAAGASRAEPASAAASAALGFFLIQAERLDEAAQTLLPACDRFPAYAPLHCYTGYLLRRRGDAAGAAEALQRACELDPGLDEAAYALAWVLHDLGRLDEAASWAAHALAMERTPPRLLQMAWLLQAVARFGEAAAFYREAIAAFAPLAPEQPRLHLHLSQCLDHLGRHAEAAVVLDEALRRWPQDADLGAQAVRSLLARGEGRAARRHAAALAERCPDSAQAWHLLGITQQEDGELEAADASFERSQMLDPGLTDALFRRAQIQRGWRRYEGAQWLLGLVLEHSPGDHAAWGLLAQVALDMEDAGQARRVLLPLLRTTRHAPDAWRLLAVAQHKRGRSRAALRWVQRALAQQPGAVEPLRILGWVALELGDPAQAAQAVRRLIGQVPDDAAAQAQAALVFAHTGELETAQAWAERAVACTPESAEAWRALSFVRLRQRRLDDADRAACEALRLAPAQPDCLRQMGWVQLALSNLGQAQLAFLRAVDANPGDAVSRLELAEAQRLAGHFEAGLQTLAPLLESRPGWPAALLAQTRLLTEAGHGDAVQACARLLRADCHLPDAAKAALRLVGLGHAGARRLLAMLPVRLLLDTWREAMALAVHTQGQDVLVRLAAAARQELDDDPWLSLTALYTASLTHEATAEGLALQARDWYRSLKIRAGLAGLPPCRPAAADEPLCIAYVAGQLHQSLLRRVLASHDRSRVRVLVYTNLPFGVLPEHVQVLPLDPRRLAESCAANSVDVA